MQDSDAHQTIDPATGLTTPQSLALEEAVKAIGNSRPKTRYRRLVEGVSTMHIDYGVVMSNSHVRGRIEDIAKIKGLSAMDVNDAYHTVGAELDQIDRNKARVKNQTKDKPNDDEMRILRSIDKFATYTNKGKRLPVPWNRVFLDIYPSLFYYKNPTSTKESSSRWLMWFQNDRRWLRVDPDQVRKWIEEMLKTDGMSDVNQIERIVNATYKNICKHARPGRYSIAGDREFLTTDDLDQCEDIICDQAGYGISLKTCGLGACRIDDPISLRLGTVYDPDAKCPEWDRFIRIISGYRDAVTEGDKVRALQRAHYLRFVAGYQLLPHNNNHLLIYFHGPAGQGKSTFLDVLYELDGHDYAVPVQSDQFIKSRGQVASDPMLVIGAMGNARLAIMSDLGDKGEWNCAQLKSLTGESYQQTRVRYEDPKTTKRKVLVIAQGNNRLNPGGGVEGLLRRMRLITFPSRIKEKDRDETLPDRLRMELPGILNWALKGLASYNRWGELAPKCIMQDTKNYLNDFGPIIRKFCAEQLIFTDKVEDMVTIKDIFERYKAWRILDGYDDVEEGDKPAGGMRLATFRKILVQNHFKVEKMQFNTGKQYGIAMHKLADVTDEINDAEYILATHKDSRKNGNGKGRQGRLAPEVPDTPPPTADALPMPTDEDGDAPADRNV